MVKFVSNKLWVEKNQYRFLAPLLFQAPRQSIVSEQIDFPFTPRPTWPASIGLSGKFRANPMSRAFGLISYTPSQDARPEPKIFAGLGQPERNDTLLSSVEI